MSSNTIKVTCITGTRADYGHQLPLFRKLMANRSFDFKLIVTGSHLVKEFGHSIDLIRQDNIPIYAELPILDNDDSSFGISMATSRALAKFAECLKDFKSDIMIVFGDRYEIFAAAQAALFMNIPMVHICGGDITEGAYDNSIRHNLTKMSSLHFPSNEKAKTRIISMGEVATNVVDVGSLCIEMIDETETLSKKELELALDFEFKEKNILMTFHPETLGSRDVVEDLSIILDSLDNFSDTGIIITKPSLDVSGKILIKKIEEFAASREHVRVFSSLGQVKYYSLLRVVDMVFGNSSSGIYEVPSFGIPTVNVGDRQKGRMTADSVIHCPLDSGEISKAIGKAFSMNCSEVMNPYGDGLTSGKMIDILLEKITEIKKRKVEHFD
jgi:UDP-hydrolysing UDP-N-acetyl-D-glucosamine 2-epimerase